MTKSTQEFGLALGGGGVKGLAHLALLKKLDDLKARPCAISGTSMGAIIGALYAAGISGIDIETRIKDHIFSKREGLKKFYKKRRQLFKWFSAFALERTRGGLVNADGLFEYLFSEIIDLEFTHLKTPFTAVATNFHTGMEVALQRGPLLPAVQASMAVPGIFAPIKIDGQLLVDGGIVNNVPCRYVTAQNRLVVASNVISLSTYSEPNSTQVLNGALSIMLQQQTVREFSHFPPDFMFTPNTDNVDAFDFHRISRVLEQADDAISQQGHSLKMLLDSRGEP